MGFLSSEPIEVFLDRFHALARERSSVLDPSVGVGSDHTAGSELLVERGILWVEIGLRFLFGVEVVEISVELVESVIRRKVLVLITQVVFSELAARVTVVLEQIGQGRVLHTDALLGAGHADSQQARAVRVLTFDERRASRGATLLRIVVGEHRALGG